MSAGNQSTASWADTAQNPSIPAVAQDTKTEQAQILDMAQSCTDCGANFGDHVDWDRCICGGRLVDGKTDAGRPGRLIDRIGDHSVKRAIYKSDVEVTGAGKVTVTFELDEDDLDL